jgi:RND family efflux transporter MFP subunit
MIKLVASTWTRTLLVTALLATAACGGRREPLPPAQGPGAPPMPSLPTVPGRTDEATAVAPTEGRTIGTTFPRAEAQIGPNAGGVISQILVKEGDKVRKGQVLFRQNTQDAALRLQQARAALEAAQVNLRGTETEFNRTKSMFDQKAVSQMQWDQVQSRMDAAKVGISQAEVARDMAQKSLADGTVRSPLTGVVVAKMKSEGEMATMMPPTVVLVVQDQSVLELRFRLPERALNQVKIGERVKARFDALNVERSAQITRIQNSIDARTRTVEVVAEIPNPDGELRSGLLAQVELGVEKTDSKPVGRAP